MVAFCRLLSRRSSSVGNTKRSFLVRVLVEYEHGFGGRGEKDLSFRALSAVASYMAEGT